MTNRLPLLLGVLPLAIATGVAGVAGGRTAIGTGVIGGMVTATVLAVFLVPVVLCLDSKVVPRKRRNGQRGAPA